MDTDLLVNYRVNLGSRFLAELVRHDYPIEAAFWAESTEDDSWRLYLATPLVEREGLGEAYGRLQPVLPWLFDAALSLADIRLVGAETTTALDVLEILARSRNQSIISQGAGSLGNVSVQRAYIYPERLYHASEHSTSIPDEVFRHLFDLLSRGPGVFPPSRVALRDGDSFDGVPISFSMGIDQASVVQFRVESDLMPRVIPTQEILSIL